LGQLRHGSGIEIETNHLMAAQPQPLRHIRAHLTQADDSKLHHSSAATL
jgi:hypothetical protein